MARENPRVILPSEMDEHGPEERVEEQALADVPTGELLGQLVQQSKQLVKKEVELARAELRDDIKAELHAATALAIAGLCALSTLSLLLVAVVLAMAESMPAWAAALVVAAMVLTVGTVAGLYGWQKRVRKPLERTQRTLEEDAQWVKERLM